MYSKGRGDMVCIVKVGGYGMYSKGKGDMVCIVKVGGICMICFKSFLNLDFPGLKNIVA